MPRTTTKAAGVSFVADWNSIQRDMGRDFDWDEANSLTSFPAGTVVSLLASGKICPRLYEPGAEGAYGFLVSDIDMNAEIGNVATGVYIGGTFMEELLPDNGDAAWGTIKTELGAAFVFLTYEDDRS